MKKYYIITKYYSSTKILTFEKKEEWLENIDDVAFDSSRGSGDTFTVGYITEEGYELAAESYRTTEFKKNKRGGYYYFDTSKLYVRKTKPEDLQEEEEEEEDLIDIENIEKKEQKVRYVTIDEVEEEDEKGNEITVYYDDVGEQYEDEDDARDANKPSKFIYI
jgi:hypothetical protein